ncbi:MULTISPECIES: TldD/PmbA family protein [unclassified Bartonella]|uniref:TldD/PmbA family protein n=1 Tax=unclassified Bartonella TaxID=2645622 RepID=UPI0015FBCAA7|nr:MULTISPECIES: TldD/PmbA family protein [unclassified Bartonella]UXN03308.1 TldD/PmbA family protein [Bartonella sp. HY406]
MSGDAQGLIDKASALVEAAKKAGADAADAVVIRSRSRQVSVRLGKVESTDSSESDDFSLRVFLGKKVATISANSQSDPQALAIRAVAMAKVSPENPFEGLADPKLLQHKPRDLDLFDATDLDSAALTHEALAMEEAALAVKGVSNSGGAGAACGAGGMVLVTSDGFCGHYMSSRFSRSCSVVAGTGTAMERDYDYSTALHFADLDHSHHIGQRAGERTVARLGAQRAKTGTVDVIFDPRMARGIAAHIASAVNGASVARKTSLLREKMGQAIMPQGITITDNPLKVRGSSSRPFDGEGVEGQMLEIVKDGVLQNWLLSTSAAMELGLTTNGHGVRSSNSVAPASTNFTIESGNISREDMIKSLKSGFYVTELVGHGVDLVTGQYSRGASGFWIENGEITYPVSEVTLGSNLLHMFAHMQAADDLDRRYGIASPSLLIEGMTLAGK